MAKLPADHVEYVKSLADAVAAMIEPVKSAIQSQDDHSILSAYNQFDRASLRLSAKLYDTLPAEIRPH